jgi:hypothetical protein
MARDVTVARQREDVEVLDPWRGRCDDTFENRAGLQVLELFRRRANDAPNRNSKRPRLVSPGCFAQGRSLVNHAG